MQWIGWQGPSKCPQRPPHNVQATYYTAISGDASLCRVMNYSRECAADRPCGFGSPHTHLFCLQNGGSISLGMFASIEPLSLESVTPVGKADLSFSSKKRLIVYHGDVSSPPPKSPAKACRGLILHSPFISIGPPR